MKILLLYLAIFMGTISSTAQKEKILTHHKADDRYASYSPDGKQIIFESNRDGNWELYLMASDGGDLQRLTSNTHDDRRPFWHPDGKKILFESNKNGRFQLFELETKTGKITKLQLPEMEGEPIFASYSPDGKYIAFSSGKSDGTSDIRIVSNKGQNLEALIIYPHRNLYPRWSPDAKSLLFFSRHETDNKDDEIYRINLDGSGKKRLTNWPKHNFCPSWSADGKKIAYVTSMENSRPEIYIMNSDGSNQQRITYNNDGDTLPNWSPDGKKLLITAFRNGNYEICELKLD
ncbi:hypothetical protein GWK08_16340 [Leptobacterium flavescens]|uniref:DUF5050 domain-containing protein n=1 Tax=Leptobacterium flavescens TaxID=472055 RepID=A0A6P0UX55_9FLAO|nr:DPP IV N-terminal domain-containing protein [Leptobacterium flavescens]NER15026.1 hypothetical protein [Leptobacterium flavescens]